MEGIRPLWWMLVSSAVLVDDSGCSESALGVGSWWELWIQCFLVRPNFKKNQLWMNWIDNAFEPTLKEQTSFSTCLIFSFDRMRIPKVERDRACIKLHHQIAGDSCCFPDILDLVEQCKSGKNWCPSNLRIKKVAYCVVHKKKCLGLFNNTVLHSST